ncbi:MAG: hypothetical protein JO023_08450 [Chloroflexi bacterium]|nr:hypothetical protein [Chloroflexota bacterium]
MGDGTRTGTIRAGYLGHDKIRASITRADIAAFLLDQTTDRRFRRAAPALSNYTRSGAPLIRPGPRRPA